MKTRANFKARVRARARCISLPTFSEQSNHFARLYMLVRYIYM